MLALVMVDGGLVVVESGCATAAAGPVGLLLAEGLGVVEVDVDDDDDGDGVEAGASGGGLGLGSELESEPESGTLPTLLSSPVKDTDQVLSPPPVFSLATISRGRSI